MTRSQTHTYQTDGNLALRTTPTSQLTVLDGGIARRDSHAEAHSSNISAFPAFIVSLAAILICLAMSYGTDLVAHQTATNSLSTAETKQIIVSSGDTLWSIAEQHPVGGASTSDIVEWIRASNNLSSSRLTIGSSIDVPTSLS